MFVKNTGLQSSRDASVWFDTRVTMASQDHLGGIPSSSVLFKDFEKDGCQLFLKRLVELTSAAIRSFFF